MKQSITFFFLGITFMGFSQENFNQADSLAAFKKNSWGDYYFINDDFSKAINQYSKFQQFLNPEQIRAFAQSLQKMGYSNQAARVMERLVQTHLAEIEDYYYYSELIPTQKKLANEYLSKANQLTFGDKPDLNKESGNPAYRLRNINSNTEKSDFGAAYLNDDQGIFFYLGPQRKIPSRLFKKKYVSTTQIYNVFQAELDTDSLNIRNSEELNLNLNSIFQDGPLALNTKTDRLYLTRSSMRSDKNKKVHLDLFQIPLDEIKKSVPQSSELNINGYSTQHPSVSLDGKKLYFSSDRPGGYGGMDLYYVLIENDKIQSSPINLGSDINTAANEVFPFSYSNEVLFYSTDLKNEQNLDIYMAVKRVSNRWKTRPLLPPFNSQDDDFSFSLVQQAQLGFLSSNRPNGKGDDDIYAFHFTPEIKGEKDSYTFNSKDTLVSGFDHVLQNDRDLMISKDPLTEIIPMQVQLVDSVHLGSLLLNSNGSFLYKQESKTQKKDSFSYQIQTPFGKSENIQVLLEPTPTPSNALKTIFRPLFFPFDQFKLTEHLKPRLDSMVIAFNKNQNLRVEVSSFADCRGSSLYNLVLSEKRSQSIVDYIREKILNPKRIYGKGYGEVEKEENLSFDYTVVVGSFSIESNAIALVEKFSSKGQAEILFDNSYYKVVVGKYDSYSIAKREKQKLIEEGYDAWIYISPCYLIPESDHQSNRKATFKIIEPKNSTPSN
ncbi:MAG: OmpA family protein [Flavobacteriaceae bacterium]